MKKRVAFLIVLILFIPCIFFNVSAQMVYADNDKIYLGGMPAGFSLKTKGAYVVGLCDVITEKGLKSPSKDAGLSIGDLILKIDGNDVDSAKDVEINILNKNSVFVEFKRNNEIIIKTVKPEKDLSGNTKLGIFIRDDISGIGTITYIRGNRFASLGHPVVDDNGEPLSVNSGQIFNCNITGYVKGVRGKAGELRGVFIKSNDFGYIDKNLKSGVYGYVNDEFLKQEDLKEITIGNAKPGSAQIYTTISGNHPTKYDVTIVKVEEGDSDKNFIIKIDDEGLLDSVGGIVQGMSGSPIIQNDKLVGAVTHVFINDPSRGFGIAISNMINN